MYNSYIALYQRPTIYGFWVLIFKSVWRAVAKKLKTQNNACEFGLSFTSETSITVATILSEESALRHPSQIPCTRIKRRYIHLNVYAKIMHVWSYAGQPSFPGLLLYTFSCLVWLRSTLLAFYCIDKQLRNRHVASVGCYSIGFCDDFQNHFMYITFCTHAFHLNLKKDTASVYMQMKGNDFCFIVAW